MGIKLEVSILELNRTKGELVYPEAITFPAHLMISWICTKEHCVEAVITVDRHECVVSEEWYILVWKSQYMHVFCSNNPVPTLHSTFVDYIVNRPILFLLQSVQFQWDFPNYTVISSICRGRASATAWFALWSIGCTGGAGGFCCCHCVDLRFQAVDFCF